MDDLNVLSWIERCKILAAFLVAIGVSGEFFGDWLAKPIERRVAALRSTEMLKLSKDVAEANERAAVANKIAEEERLARIKIEEKIAPRRLSQEQQNTITAKLMPFAGIRMNFWAYSGDTEIAEFAQDM